MRTIEGKEDSNEQRRRVLKKDREKNELQIITPPGPWPTLTIDVEFYLKFLKESDAPESEKRQLIETIWSIVVSFVDLGFDIHPLQQALPDECAQLPDMNEILASDLGDVVSSKHQLSKNQFIEAASSTCQERSGGNES